jgi:hypothetical protein
MEPPRRTARNLDRGGRVRIGVGQLRDVTMIDGTVESLRDEGRR